MNVNKLFSEFSLNKIWNKLKQHDKALNCTFLILSIDNWIEQENKTFKNVIEYSTFKNTDKLTVDLYDDGSLSENTIIEYEQYIDNFEIVNGGLVAIANTKPTKNMVLVVKGDFECIEVNLHGLLSRLEQMESNFTMAASAIGDALVAKEIEVPEGTSLLEMADMIRNANSLSPKVTIIYQIEKTQYYSEQVSKGESILHPTTFTPTKSGWTFVGWRKDTTASATVLSNEMAVNALTLYAVFKQNITLSYNANGGSGSLDSQVGVKYYNNDNVLNPTFTLKANTFTKTDGIFQKWAQGSATGTQYAVGANITLSANTTFYAIWKITKQTGRFYVSMWANENKTFSVTFPEAFLSVPTVTYTITNTDASNNWRYFTVSVESRTATGCVFRVKGNGSSGKGTGGYINWTATVS